MKKLFVLLLLAPVAAFSASQYSCQKFAEAVAVRAMNKSLAAEQRSNAAADPSQSKYLSRELRAQLSETIFLDKDENPADSDTGAYGVVMTVMEECLDGLKIETKVVIKNSLPSCRLIKISSFGDRDCG